MDPAKKGLIEQGEEILDSYVVQSDGMYGYLLLLNNKFMFVEEKGFLHKRYFLMLEIPYEKINSITVDNHGKLTVTGAEGHKYNFTSFDPLIVPISMIENRFKELTEMRRTMHVATRFYIA